ncbi:MAG: hypothetical protein HYR59_01740 [Acidobacteria bacterium]|nr:hypothetical protein [Acidobacteriota bacterium]
MSIRDWQITQPKRMLAGTGSPNLLQKTWMHIGYFCASELNCDWSPPGHSKVRTRLKARTGELEIPNDRSAEQTRFVLDEVRNAGGAPYGIPQLEELARQHREWGGLLPKVDLHLSRLNKREIELEKLAEDEWLPLDDLAKAIHTASEKYPGLFKVLYEVRCPETGKTAHNRKQVAKYESPTAIPPEVPCRHKHGVVMHPSRNNIRQVLVFQPKGGPGGKGLVPLIRPFIETRIPPPLSERFVRGIEILLFAVLFVPLSWVTVLAFAWLAAKFPEFRAGIDRSFWLVQVLLAGAVAAVLDRRYLEMALNIFQGFPKSVGKRLASLRKRADADDAPQQPPDKDT